MELDMDKIINNLTEEIAMQAVETQKEFIFETTYPYCENVLQMKVNKEELRQILLDGLQKRQTGQWISSVSTSVDGKTKYYVCSSCGWSILWSDKMCWTYCPNCGAKMETEVKSNG